MMFDVRNMRKSLGNFFLIQQLKSQSRTHANNEETNKQRVQILIHTCEKESLCVEQYKTENDYNN